MQPLSFGALTLLMLDSDISHISWIPSTAVGHPVLLKYLGHSDTYNFDLYFSLPVLSIFELFMPCIKFIALPSQYYC